MNGQNQSPIQEAISLVTIVAILISVACYIGSMQNAPIITPALNYVASLIYNWMPALNGLRSPQIPALAASAGVGVVTFFVGLAFSSPIAGLFSQSQIAGIERQTIRLKKNRERIIKRRRDRDSFDVQ